jgi:hypothetical protein
MRIVACQPISGVLPGPNSWALRGSRRAVAARFSGLVTGALSVVGSGWEAYRPSTTHRSTSRYAKTPDAHAPSPPSERGAWLLALVLCALGVAVLAAVLTGTVGRTTRTIVVPLPPTVHVAQAAAVAWAASATAVGRPSGLGYGSERSYSRVARGEHRESRSPRMAILARPSVAQQRAEERSSVDATQTHISGAWMEGFYPIYATAQSTFGVNWLLIASIHRQESAFSTAPGIYHGLNFANCCGGPMQFNVTNGPVSTWDLVADSYEYGQRPAHYDHMTSTHPSIYDDFDSIMAAAHLLSSDGAEYALNESAWDAAYDYYGHDAAGVTYADQVLARAISWSQHGFCINCGLEPATVEAVQAAYGPPVLHLLSPAATTSISHTRGQR